MSLNFNKVMLMGNLVRDPVLRATPSGKAVGDMRIAVNRHFRDSSSNLQKEVLYITIVVWERLAENCKKFLSKGRPVFVEGRLMQDSWEKDGVTRTEIKAVAERVVFLPTGNRMSSSEQGEEKTDESQPFDTGSGGVNETTPDDDLPF